MFNSDFGLSILLRLRCQNYMLDCDSSMLNFNPYAKREVGKQKESVDFRSWNPKTLFFSLLGVPNCTIVSFYFLFGSFS